MQACRNVPGCGQRPSSARRGGTRSTRHASAGRAQRRQPPAAAAAQRQRQPAPGAAETGAPDGAGAAARGARAGQLRGAGGSSSQKGKAAAAVGKPEFGSPVLDALRETDGTKKRRSRLPEAPSNMFDDSKRGLPKEGWTFEALAGGAANGDVAEGSPERPDFGTLERTKSLLAAARLAAVPRRLTTLAQT
ncbi:hypothetical protein E2562_026015 [Oryza meyeriana var. granulata]|uniref:Uncharacterized protein n=1 Tax=Oryza meyeriana var. granulata TaxID=110450 RepID=A0A6G1EPL2_9ORYZ|nr:hypothetical protein E2562_026015 [Oryza meyeriana var. granulata]